MALSQLYTAITGDVITAARWNNEYGNIYSNALSLISPLTGTLNANTNNITSVTNLSFATSGSITGTVQLSTTTVGPHAIGGATNADVGLLITGAQATATAMAVQISSTTVPATGESSYGINLIPTLTEFSAGVHSLLAGINIAPTVTAGAGTVTTLAGLATGALTAQSGTDNAAGIYVSAAPTGATNNYALWSAAGNWRIDGGDIIGGVAGAQGRISFATATRLDISTGSLGLLFLNNASTIERMRLTDGGLLTLASDGMTISTAAPATPLAKTLYEDSIVKGWVVFQVNGTIDDDVNVSSITDNAVGDWTVNWATAFTTPNYSVFCNLQSDGAAGGGPSDLKVDDDNNPTTTACRVINGANAAEADPTGTRVRMYVMAIGNN